LKIGGFHPPYNIDFPTLPEQTLSDGSGDVGSILAAGSRSGLSLTGNPILSGSSLTYMSLGR